MKYKVELKQGSFDYSKSFYYERLEDLKSRIQNKKNNEKVVSILEYHLVYEHPIHLPPPKEIHELTKHHIYESMIRTPKENIVPATQDRYKHNFIKDSAFQHYCIKYDVLGKHEEFGYIYKQSAHFELRNQDRKAIMKALYQHSKSNQIFNLRLYQYRYLSLDEILHE